MKILIAIMVAIVTTAASAAPNVLVVVIDDPGYADFTGRGDDIVLPQLEGFAKRSVRCSHGYATASLCSQSRAGLLTGRTPQSMEYWNLDQTLPSGVPILPELTASTHRTFCIGKWHHGTTVQPLERGWQQWYGWRAATRWYVPYGTSSHWVNQSLERNGTVIVDPPGHLTDWLADEALGAMRSTGDKPWLVWLAPLAVHAPNNKYHCHPDWYAKAPGAINTIRRAYAAQAMHLDARLGDVVAEAERQDALIIVTADNGGLLGVANNRPLVGGKSAHTDGGIRVPLFVRWGTRFPQRDYDQPVSHLDLLPTILAASDLNQPVELAGVNLTPYLTGSRGNFPPHDYLEWDRTKCIVPGPAPRTVLHSSGLKLMLADPAWLSWSDSESVQLDLSSWSEPANRLKKVTPSPP